LLERGLELFAEGVIGVVVEGLTLPEAIDLRRDLLRAAPQAPQRRKMPIADLDGLQVAGEDILVVLGIGARLRHRAHIGEKPHFRQPQEADKLLDRAGRVPDGEEGQGQEAVSFRRQGAQLAALLSSARVTAKCPDRGCFRSLARCRRLHGSPSESSPIVSGPREEARPTTIQKPQARSPGLLRSGARYDGARARSAIAM